MIKKEMIAMLLAGGQGSRLGVLTAKVAKPFLAILYISPLAFLVFKYQQL